MFRVRPKRGRSAAWPRGCGLTPASQGAVPTGLGLCCWLTHGLRRGLMSAVPAGLGSGRCQGRVHLTNWDLAGGKPLRGKAGALVAVSKNREEKSRSFAVRRMTISKFCGRLGRARMIVPVLAEGLRAQARVAGCRPYRTWSLLLAYPRLTPWANVCRPCGTGVGEMPGPGAPYELGLGRGGKPLRGKAGALVAVSKNSEEKSRSFAVLRMTDLKFGRLSRERPGATRTRAGPSLRSG